MEKEQDAPALKFRFSNAPQKKGTHVLHHMQQTKTSDTIVNMSQHQYHLSPNNSPKLPKFSFKSLQRDSLKEVKPVHKVILVPSQQNINTAQNIRGRQEIKKKRQRVQQLRRVLSERKLKVDNRYDCLEKKLESLKGQYLGQQHKFVIINKAIAEYF